MISTFTLPVYCCPLIVTVILELISDFKRNLMKCPQLSQLAANTPALTLSFLNKCL